MSKDANIYIEHARLRATELIVNRYKVVTHPAGGGFAVAVPFSVDSSACSYVGGFGDKNSALIAMEGMKQAFRDSVFFKSKESNTCETQLTFF